MDLLEQALIADTTKHLSKLHHLLLNERERDDSTLPLDLWKSNVSSLTVEGYALVRLSYTCYLQLGYHTCYSRCTLRK